MIEESLEPYLLAALENVTHFQESAFYLLVYGMYVEYLCLIIGELHFVFLMSVNRCILGIVYNSRFPYDFLGKYLVLFIPLSFPFHSALPSSTPIYPFLFHNSLWGLYKSAFYLSLPI